VQQAASSIKMKKVFATRQRLDRCIGRLLNISKDAVLPLLAQQRVSVDGLMVTDRALLVDSFNVVSVDGRVLQGRAPLYVMLHKPRGVLSATSDPCHPLATDLITHPATSELHIAGRLDLHASGLLLLTNDSRWSRRLSDPAAGVGKQYEVRLRDALSADYAAAFAAGMYFAFEDLTTRPALLEITGSHTALVTLQEGRYHQLKRMFGRFRNPVLGIHRIRIGKLELDPALQPGDWRELSMEECAAACVSAAI
jgi:16S rRNA pseudouridine516 synthase